jgi:DNA replication protein DnaC
MSDPEDNGRLTPLAELLADLRVKMAATWPTAEPAPMPTHEERRALGPEYADCMCQGQGGTGRAHPLAVEVNGERLPARLEDGADFPTWSAPCPCPDGVAHWQARTERRERFLAMLRDARVAALIGPARIPAKYQDARFTVESWGEEALVRGAAPAFVERVKRTLADWERGALTGDAKCLLLLYGNWGVGKTGLAAVLARRWIEAERSVLFRQVVRMADELQAAPLRKDDPEDTRTTLLAVKTAYEEAALLVLDDLSREGLGTHNAEVMRGAIFEIVDARLEANRPTILITNLLAEELAESFGARLVSRLKGAQVYRLRLDNADLRV